MKSWQECVLGGGGHFVVPLHRRRECPPSCLFLFYFFFFFLRSTGGSIARPRQALPTLMLRKQRPTSVFPHFQDGLVSVTYNTSAVPVSPTQTVRVCYLAVVTPRIRDCVLPLCPRVLTTARFLACFFFLLSSGQGVRKMTEVFV